MQLRQQVEEIKVKLIIHDSGLAVKILCPVLIVEEFYKDDISI